MRALLDTSTFLWFIAGDDRLSMRARHFMVDLDNELVLSVASLWEIAIKVSLGKLELLRLFGELMPEQLKENKIRVLDIELSHLSVMIELLFHHRDPFDRLIIAQSITAGLPLIACNGFFSKYPVELIW